MKTLVLYASKYGATKALAEKIASKMPGEALAVKVGGQPADMNAYDTIILGTPIYMGKSHKEMKHFVSKNLPILLQKRIGLFLCCLQDENDSVSRQFQIAFPKALRNHALCLAALGGAVDRNQLSAFDGLIMRIVSANLPNDNRVISTLSEERIDQLIERMKAEPIPSP